MKKLLCSKCNQVMNQIKQYDAMYIADMRGLETTLKQERKSKKVTGDFNKEVKEKIIMIEEHQCKNNDCKDYAKVKYYQIKGNAALQIKPETFTIKQFPKK